jgi:hypothetical protein
MGKTIPLAVLMTAAAFAFAGSAYALDAGITCDIDDAAQEHVVLEGSTPTPDQTPAPSS